MIVALSVGLGFVNEYRSARAVAALHADIRYQALVRRGGTEERVDVTTLVPGDVVALRVGDVVPADLRLLEANGLECDEAVLTGESLPAPKSTAAGPLSDSAVDLPSCAFMGTIVHQGSGEGVVVATGMATAFGKIAVGLGERQAETAFQVGLRGFSALLVKVAGVLTVSIFAINVAFYRPLIDALLFSLAIAIGITPQLLPAIVSVSLSSGSRALARKRVLVKRLVTIEDLGNIDMLFTDKTGTLTEGAITFQATLDASGAPALASLRLGLVCNEAAMTPAGPVGGNALDLALYDADDAPALLSAPDGPRAYERLATLPFDHERQLATVLARRGQDDPVLVTKGAPEAVIARCTGASDEARRILQGLFDDGARVLAVATRNAPGLTQLSVADERDLHLEGFLTFVDRPKADAGASIAKLAHLGRDGQDHHRRQRRRRRQGLPRPRHGGRAGAHRRRHRPPRRCGAPGGHRQDHRLRASAPSRSRASSRSPAAPVSTSPSSATGSTTPSPCTPPTSASRSSPPPTWPRTPPTSSCSTRTSASSPTA